MVIALAATDLARAERAPHRSHWWTWVVVTVVFAALSFDEMSRFHERVQANLEERTSLAGTLPALTGVIVVLPVAVAFAVAMIPLLRAIPRPASRRFLLAGVVYVSGAMVVDAVSGMLDTDNQVLIHLEEGLEMAGAAMFLVAIVAYRELVSREESAMRSTFDAAPGAQAERVRVR